VPYRVPISIPLEGHPFVTAEVFWNERSSHSAINFAVDTGATDITLSQADALKLGAELKDLPHSRTKIGGIGGRADCFEMSGLTLVFLCSPSGTLIANIESVDVVKAPTIERHKDHHKGVMTECKISIPSLMGRAFLKEKHATLFWDFGKDVAYLDFPV